MGRGSLPSGKLIDDMFLYLDAFLELDEKTIIEARRLNRRILDSAGGTVDFSQGTIPHITLYMGYFPIDQERAVASALSVLASLCSPFPITIGKSFRSTSKASSPPSSIFSIPCISSTPVTTNSPPPDPTPGKLNFETFETGLKTDMETGLEISPEGYLFWRVLLDAPLARLHKAVVEVLDPLRNGAVRPKFLDLIDQYKPHEQENIRRYGFPWVLEDFSPHITLGAVEPRLTKEVGQNLHPPERTFPARALGLGTVGNSGVVRPGQRFSFITT
ncbi:MAG: DUF1045 domain-containing protein [Candidatus Ozemobacteraceae bacterium]